jgi:serine/threonine protein kinase
MGTSVYAAPEMVDRTGVDARAADAFACGATLHTMLCRAPPWQVARPGEPWPYWENFCADPASVAHQLFWQNKRPTSASAKELMRGLMASDPADRMSVADAISALDKMLINAHLTCVFISQTAYYSCIMKL